MYPDWIKNMFIQNPCTNCRENVTHDDITAIGICRPEPYAAHLRESSAMILVTCKKCQQRMNFITRYPHDQLLEALAELVQQIEEAPQAKPPLFGPGSTALATPVQSDDNSPQRNPKVRPSIREGQNLNPVTQEEIRDFLGRMKRMSFKTGSRGMNKFTGNGEKTGNDSKED